jgi:hypothetical protein
MRIRHHRIEYFLCFPSRATSSLLAPVLQRRSSAFGGGVAPRPQLPHTQHHPSVTMPTLQQIECEIHLFQQNRVANQTGVIELRSKEETDRADSEGLTRLPARSLACSSIRRRPSFNWADPWNSAWTGPRPHAAIARTRCHRSRAHAPRAAPSCSRVGARTIAAAPVPGAGVSSRSRAVAVAPA